ncbi:hypothetical protein DFH09DRAFT_1088843 [Mycena vulgaris]|nr:hypothetical protein DFH09DRAFT_1088843 [Mycena vulgaris]
MVENRVHLPRDTSSREDGILNKTHHWTWSNYIEQAVHDIPVDPSRPCRRPSRPMAITDAHMPRTGPSPLASLIPMHTLHTRYKPDDRDALNVRERRFLLALAHHDYRTAKGGAPVTQFDYTLEPVSITVHGEDGKALRAHGEESAEGVARAARSGGSLELHVVRVMQGRVSRVLLLPLRQYPGDAYGGLKGTLLREMAD